MSYNPEEIEEILRRYTSDSSAQEPKPETKVEPKPEPKPEPKVEVKPEPKVQDKWQSLDEEAPKEGARFKLKGGSTKKSAVEQFEEEVPVPPERETISNVLKPESVLRRGDTGSAPKPSHEETAPAKTEESSAPKNKYEEAEEIDRRISRAEIMKKKTSAEARKEAAIKQKKKKRKTAILNTLLVIFILIFLGSGTYLGLYFYKIRKAENSFDDVKKLIKEDGSKDPETGKKQDTDFTSYETIEGNLVQSKFADVYTKNPDFIGWLTIPGTNVDYPVMYTPDDEQKYLHMDFNGDYSSSGTLFAAAGSNPLKARDNTLIYGHNMKAGTMFHALLSYESESFYKEHSKIIFNTTFEDAEYEVIAAFRTKIDEDDPNSFKYYEFFKAENKEEFDAYVQKVKSLTPYNIEESAVYGENLLTLSTCAYHTNEGRYVVVAKKIKN